MRAGKSASLKVVVIKALNGRAAVRVRGNGGYSKRVSASQVLKVPAGRYRIEAESVRTRSWSSKPVLSARKVTLAPGKKKTVRVSYWDTVSSQVRVPGKTDTLRFEAPGVSDSGLLRSKTRYRRGTILASGPSKAAPYGFLVEVEEVTGGSGAFVHQVRQADLTEALPRGDFSVDEAVDFEGESKPLTGGNSGRGGRGLNCSASGSANVDTQMSFSSGFYLDASWGFLSGTQARVGVKPVARASFSASLSGSGSCFIDPITLHQETFQPIVIVIGVVPIVILPTLSIEAGAEASIQGSLALDGWVEARAEAGLDYDSERAGPNLQFPVSGPTLQHGLSLNPQASANLWAFGKARLSFLVYGITGPYASVKFGPDATADINGNPWWRVGGRFDAGVGFKLSLLDLDISKDDLISRRFDLLDSGGPFPRTRHAVTVARTGTGSGTVDAPGITCGLDCKEDYDEGASVVLRATPAPGSNFTGWSGACAGAGTDNLCNLSVDSAKSASANFAPNVPPPPFTQAPLELTGTGTSLVNSEVVLGDQSQMTKLPEFWPEPAPSNPALWLPGPAWVLSSGNVEEVAGSPETLASTDWGRPGSPLLTSLSGFPTEDAMELRMRVNPSGSTLRVKYIFATEEYPDFVDQEYNDVMAITVGGNNCAVVPGTSLPVSVNTVNSSTNSQYFIDNRTGETGLNTVFNGLTVPLECTANVTPGQPVDVVLSVADASDGILDSAVGLPPDAVSSP
ncbi:MAG: choice-of-anchor L domain-containing protein [Solirubrobacterales bacterium]